MELKDDGEKKPASKADDPKYARPAQSRLYQPDVAMEFFKSAGKVEKFAADKPIFVENEAASGTFSGGHRMYFLLDGEVLLSVKKKPIGLVQKGEVFGEMASITQLPRTATALAKKPCSVISLNEKQFLGGLAKKPEFGLMLMAILIHRLREATAKVTAAAPPPAPPAKPVEQPAPPTPADADWGKAAVFERKLLADLEREFEDKPAQSHPLNKVIVKEGDRGMFMYVVHEGIIEVVVGDKIVEKVGPGGVFGEMALVDQSTRAATAKAETDCILLAINRTDFLALVKSKPAFTVSLLKGLSERLRYMTSKLK